MKQKNDYKEANATRIVGDCFTTDDAETSEQICQPVCRLTTIGVTGLAQNAHAAIYPSSYAAPQVHPPLSVRGLAAAVSIASMFAVVGTMAVHLGHDWGYKLVDALMGQPEGGKQGICGAFSLIFFILPLFYGLVLGGAKNAWRGTSRWSTVGSLIMIGIMITFACNWIGTDYEVWKETPLWFLSAMLFNTFGIWFGEHTYAALRLRIRLMPVLWCTVFTLIPMAAALFVLPESTDFRIELALYAVTIALAGGLAARFGKAQTRVAAVLFAMTATLPFVLANLVNVGGNIICLIMDGFGIGPAMGYHALLSGMFISVTAMGASTAGGLIGFKANR